jgi:hypothetical protein
MILTGLDWCARRLQLSFEMFQSSNAIQSTVNAVQSVGMKGNREYVLRHEHDQCIDDIQSHANEKCPLFAFAREIPEEHEYSRDTAIR